MKSHDLNTIEVHELLQIYLTVYGEVLADVIRTEVPELPEEEIASALVRIDASAYAGDASDISALAHFVWQRAVIEAKKLALILQVYAPNSTYRASVYSGILDKLTKANDLVQCSYKNKHDLFYEVLEYLIEEGAENFVTSPSTASMETRLHKLAAQHTRLYVTELIRRRNSVKNRKKPFQVGTIVNNHELAIMKAQQKRELEHKGRIFAA